jgi:hypothetical protein
MRILHTILLAGAVAFGIAAAAAAAPVTLDFQFNGSSVPGTGSVTVDPAGAPTTDPYEFRAGDTFIASFDFSSVIITFDEQDALNPVLVPFTGGIPTDVYYSGFLDEATGIDLGFISFISLSMGEGGWTLGFLTDDGFEITINGTYVILQDGSETPVPAPAAALLFASGLVGLGWARRRRA